MVLPTQQDRSHYFLNLIGSKAKDNEEGKLFIILYDPLSDLLKNNCCEKFEK